MKKEKQLICRYETYDKRTLRPLEPDISEEYKNEPFEMGTRNSWIWNNEILIKRINENYIMIKGGKWRPISELDDVIDELLYSDVDLAEVALITPGIRKFKEHIYTMYTPIIEEDSIYFLDDK